MTILYRVTGSIKQVSEIRYQDQLETCSKTWKKNLFLGHAIKINFFIFISKKMDEKKGQ